MLMDNVITREMLCGALEIYENEMLESLNEESFETSKEFEKKMQSLLKSRDSLYHRLTLTKARKVITAFAAALVVLLCALSVGAIRESILSFFVDRGNVKVIEYNTEDSSDYPRVIGSTYTPGYLPQGYALSDSSSDDLRSYKLYVNGEDFLSIEQFTKSSYKSAFDLDTMEKESYQGIDFVVQTSSDSTVLIWEMDGYVFEMTGFIDKSELFKAAASLKPDKEG